VFCEPFVDIEKEVLLGPQDPNPITVLPGKTDISQDQVTAPLLCSGCEQRFSKQGEHYVLLNTFRGPGKFRFFEIFRKARPLPRDHSGTAYSGSAVLGGAEVDRLVYFGASVFWRASVSSFRNLGSPGPLISLGRYEEDFRRFLLGLAEFPQNSAIWVAVSNTPSPAPVMNFPISQRVDSYYQHIFEIPGMSFLLFVGNQLTKHIREFCAARSPERIIYFTDIDSLIRADSRRVFATSPATAKLRRRVDAEIKKRGEPPAP
jgi:hypothetical protein